MKRTRAEILELQKQDTYTITLTKEQARLIGFALGTEIENNEKVMKELQADLKNGKYETEEQKKLINDTIKFMLDSSFKLIDLREDLKCFYGWLVD